ncbi:MAG: ABC-F family ATP-binding cassette domain-containing protein, partial [Ruminococcaceae bacterium]|nr:ABC-F family ATP-binding cassette domain-containing protein [Oscillospiraceae bacterium]
DRSVYEETLEIFRPLMDMEDELEAIHDEVERSGGDRKLIERQQELTERFNDGGGLTYRARTRSALTGLGFTAEQQAQRVSTLSGGQRSKVQLCKLLLSGANLLLLDEPTNHLDIQATEWLEEFLTSYNGAYIVVSHDRYFLDKVTNTTMELENCRLRTYNGSYSVYMKAKMEDREFAQRHYENTQREIKRIEGIIEQQKRWNQERNYVTIASKQKQIDRLKATLVKVESLPKELHFSFPSKEITANEVLVTDRLAFSYGTKRIFSEVSLRVMKQERIFLIGSNGCGKSTLFKVLASKMAGTAGSFNMGNGVECGYFDQTLSGLHPEKQVIDEVWDRYPRMTETEVRSALAIFLFFGDAVFKKVGTLSGGEKAKLALLCLMLSKANLLLLDEPTNHLDIKSREALEQALMEYEGTLFIVSHDRYFINLLADRIYYMDEGGITEYIGDYDYFEEHRPVKAAAVKQKADRPNEYKQRKERESAARKRKTQIERTERRIEEIADEQGQLTEQLSLPETAADYQRVLELTAQMDELTAEENRLYELLERLYAEEEEYRQEG